MPAKNVYFETNGIAWNNYKIIGTATVLGNAIILDSASSAQLVIDVALGAPSLLGNACGSLDKVMLTYPDGSVDTLYDAVYGCGTFPIMCKCPGSYRTNIELSNITSLQGQSLTLSATSFGAPFGASQNNWVLNAYIIENIPQTSATLQITVDAGGKGLSNALIAVTDNTTDYTTTLTTDASGNATLTGISVGDSVTLSISESGYTTNHSTVTIYYVNSKVTIPLVATTTGQITNIFKYVAIAGGIIIGGAVTYEVAKGISSKEEILAEREIPKLP